MYELSVQREFCAAHALVIGGEREPVHGHNWRVTAVVSGRTLDDDGLLCDFHEIERQLDGIVSELDLSDLNEAPLMQGMNPTAERVAEIIARALAERLSTGVNVARVSVTEAPGCTATYRMGVT